MVTNREIDEVLGPYIITYSGTKFYYLSPEKSEINIVDIAHALSNMCRFSGHTSKFYSVAEHSVYVSAMCEDPLEGLLHDASEAFMCDLSSPLKGLVADYKAIQKHIEKAICDKYDITYPFSFNLKDRDTCQLKTEARHLLSVYDWIEHYPTERKYGIIPVGLSPAKAKQLFLNTYKEIVINGNQRTKSGNF